jgi:hypothetical protein
MVLVECDVLVLQELESRVNKIRQDTSSLFIWLKIRILDNCSGFDKHPQGFTLEKIKMT